ncbi:MAG: acyl-[ACP]--phospholipid O-acyltransferase, partial [Planctomycetes bacterium]|nr:acyl-[ACP]--phospholipid O-acyltransferase [Planctomycetota bacterium]
GEMVPHGKVEEALHRAAGVEDRQVFAVTGLPDPRKGERLAVLHTHDVSALPGVLAGLGEQGLPNLFVPRLEQFVAVEAIPVLGTGKVDLMAVRRLAREALATAAEDG